MIEKSILTAIYYFFIILLIRIYNFKYSKVRVFFKKKQFSESFFKNPEMKIKTIVLVPDLPKKIPIKLQWLEGFIKDH